MLIFPALCCVSVVDEEDEEDEPGAMDDWLQENAKLGWEPPAFLGQAPRGDFERLTSMFKIARDQPSHKSLRADLIEHIWERFGHRYSELVG